MTYPHRFLSLLAVLLILTAPTMQAQTPATTVKDSDENVVFQSNADGGLLAPGTFGTGTIPTEGAGTRMMWHPEIAAFRAGRVFFNPAGAFDGSNFWNASNVGEYSAAFGKNTKASGNGAVAMGQRTTASGFGATAMGDGTVASGDRSVAMNSATTASGGSAVAMNNADASGNLATAMGRFTQANGFGTVTMGDRTVAATRSSVTIGRCNSSNQSSSNYLFVVGNGPINNSTGFCDSRDDALILDDGGTLTVSNQTTFSDRRLKTQIDPLEEGVLRKLGEIHPVRYEFKNQDRRPSGEQIGLVAQDVQKEFPALVSEDSGGMLSLAYPKLTAVLVKGLQEQQAEIGLQQATIDSLKQKVRSLQTVKTRQARLAEQVAALQRDRSGVLPAGWGASTLLALLLVLGGFGAGFLWRRMGA